MNDGEAKVYKAGESWYEAPGCHHRISDNASKTEPAAVHATFIIKTKVLEDEGHQVLVQIDEEYKVAAAEQMGSEAVSSVASKAGEALGVK